MTSKNRVSRAAFRVAIPLIVAALFVPMIASAQTGTLFVEGDMVGIGTSSPTSDLEILDTDFATLRLSIDAGATWAFAATDAGDFTVNKIGSGGQEFSVRTRNNGAGVPTMKVQGTVEASGGFLNSSSRNMKTDFSLLDGKEVLDKLAEMPVMSWRYKEDGTEALHFGPMAEDFQAAFQLGNGTTISSIDADGVALAAIQGLYTAVQEKDAEIEELRARLAQLESVLESLTRN